MTFHAPPAEAAGGIAQGASAMRPFPESAIVGLMMGAAYRF